MNANLVSIPFTSNSQWYPDTGSNVHLTNELSNLNMHAEDYTGTDQIPSRQWPRLHISNSGCGLLPTPTRNFHLFSLFHVPQIQKNLISVNQFTCDNYVFIKFHHTFFCVKDLHTRQLLPLPGLLLPLLVRRSPWISGILGLAILHLLLSTKLFSLILYPCLHQSLPPLFLLQLNMKCVLLLFVSNNLLKHSLIPKSNLSKVIMVANLAHFNLHSLPWEFLID